MRIATVSFILMCSAPTGLVAQRTLPVPQTYATIQAAIDAANGGESVVVAPGTYAENLDFKGKAIRVWSSGGNAVTTIDGGQNGPVVRFASAEGRGSVLEGFTLTNGRGESVNFERRGGGVYCDRSSPTIIDNQIRVNRLPGSIGNFGGGVYTRGGSPRIARNTFSDNWATQGGAIYCVGGIAPEIRDNVFDLNAAWTNGGAIACAGGAATIDGNAFLSNSTIDQGGAIWCSSATVSVTANSFTANDATGGIGGAIYVTQGTVMLTNNSIFGNYAFLEAGAVYVERCTLTSVNDTISQCGTRGSTGGIYALGARVTLTNTICWPNYGGGTGVEISLVSGSTGAIDYCDIDGLRQRIAVNTSTLQWGTSNIDVDPKLIGSISGRLHIPSDSPCRDVGTTNATTPSVDIDGDRRGIDAGIDIGADEYFPHLEFARRWTTTRLGKITIIGPAGAPVFLGISAAATLGTPTVVPGLRGMLAIQVPLTVAPLGTVSASGAIELYPRTFGLPPATITAQALVGLQLTNAEVVRIP